MNHLFITYHFDNDQKSAVILDEDTEIKTTGAFVAKVQDIYPSEGWTFDDGEKPEDWTRDDDYMQLCVYVSDTNYFLAQLSAK